MTIIAISRGIASDSAALVDMIAEQSGYQTLSRDVLLESTKKYNITEEELQAAFEKTPGLLDRFMAKRNRYLVFVQASLLEAVQEDDVVYHGYAGQILLEGISHVLKVRVEVPLEQRVAAYVAHGGLGPKEAEKAILAADQKRERWLQVVYGRDWRDPALYDLVINLANMSHQTACYVILHAAAQKEFQATQASQASLENLLLESEVKSAFAADDTLYNQPLVVSASSGVIVVRGQVKTRQQQESVEDMVTKVKGVRSHHVHVGLLSDGFREHHL